MDSTNGGIIAIVGLIVSVGSSMLAIVNHRRIRSNCCGLPLVASIDVENTTPQECPSTLAPIRIPAPRSAHPEPSLRKPAAPLNVEV